MAFETLKTLINNNIKSGLPNGIRPEEEHNPVLQSIVTTLGSGYAYMGLATTGSSPLVDDVKRMYITSGYGTYTAFLDSNASAIEVADKHISVIKGVSGVWTQDVIVDLSLANTDIPKYSDDVLAKLARFDKKHAQQEMIGSDVSAYWTYNKSNLVNEITNGLDAIGYYYKQHEAAGTLDSFQEFFTINMISGDYMGSPTNFNNIMDVKSGIPSASGNYNILPSTSMGYINDGKNLLASSIGHANGTWLGEVQHSFSNGSNIGQPDPDKQWRDAWGICTQKMNWQPTALTTAGAYSDASGTLGQTLGSNIPKWDNNNITVAPRESDNMLPQTNIKAADWNLSGGATIDDIVGEYVPNGVELVYNGEFNEPTGTSSDWILDTLITNPSASNWSIANGVAHCDGSQLINESISQSNVVANINVGDKVRITYEVLNMNAGNGNNIKWDIGNGSIESMHPRFADGIYTEDFFMPDTNSKTLSFLPSSDFIGDIDNVSVQVLENASGLSLGNSGGTATIVTDWAESSKEYKLRFKTNDADAYMTVFTGSQVTQFGQAIPYFEESGVRYHEMQFSATIESEFEYRVTLKGGLSNAAVISEIELVEVYNDTDVYKTTPALMSANQYGTNRTGLVNGVGQDWFGISVETSNGSDDDIYVEGTKLTWDLGTGHQNIKMLPPVMSNDTSNQADASTRMLQIRLYIESIAGVIRFGTDAIISECGYHDFVVDASSGSDAGLVWLYSSYYGDGKVTFNMAKSSVSYYRSSTVKRHDGVTLLQGASSVLPQYTEFDPFQQDIFYNGDMMNLDWDEPEYNWFGNVVMSVMAKAGDLSHLVIGATDFDDAEKTNPVVSANYQYFNLVDGTLGSSNNTTKAGMQEMADGWYNCWVSFPHDSTLGGFSTIRLSQSDSDYDTAVPTFTTTEGADGITLAYPDYLPEILPREIMVSTNSTVNRQYAYGTQLFSEDIFLSEVLASTRSGYDKEQEFYMYAEINNPFVNVPEYSSARGMIVAEDAIYEDSIYWSMGFYREYGDETLYPNTVHLGIWNGEEWDWDLLLTAELPSGWQDENDGFVKFGAKIKSGSYTLYANGVEMGVIEDEAPYSAPKCNTFGTSYESGMTNVGHVRAMGFTPIGSITDEQLMNLTSID